MYPTDSVSLWILLCQIAAFKRLHAFLQKQKPSRWKLFFVFIIFILGIPFRILYLYYQIIIKNRDTIKIGLLNMYLKEINNVEKLKIEMYDSRIC